METAAVTLPASKEKMGTKPRKNPVAKHVPKKVYIYDASNEGLPLYGVIVQWDPKTKYSTRALLTKFEPKLAVFRPGLKGPNKMSNGTKSLKRKMNPFLRRVGPNKAMVMFNDMIQANEFATIKDPEFSAFIPMSFVSTIGLAVFSKASFKSNEIQQFLPDGYEALQWRKKRLENSKVQVTIAVRGTKIPDNLNFKGDTIPFELYERKPVHCTRCLREGIPPPYDRQKRLCVPVAMRQLCLRPDRKYCEVGRVAHEVGWKYRDIVNNLEAKRKIKSRLSYLHKKKLKKLTWKARATVAEKVKDQDSVLKKYGYLTSEFEKKWSRPVLNVQPAKPGKKKRHAAVGSE